MHNALGTTAERNTYRIGWGSCVVTAGTRVPALLYRAKRDFPSKTYRKNTYPLMNIAAVRGNLCHAYGLHSELLRSAFLVLSIHMHTTSNW